MTKPKPKIAKKLKAKPVIKVAKTERPQATTPGGRAGLPPPSIAAPAASQATPDPAASSSPTTPVTPIPPTDAALPPPSPVVTQNVVTQNAKTPPLTQPIVATPKPPKVIICLSGKGGVGKTTVAVSLGLALQHMGYSTGIVDIDIHGPNVPTALKMRDCIAEMDGATRTIEPVVHPSGLKVWSLALKYRMKGTPEADWVVPENQPIMLEGQTKLKLVEQFLTNLDWGTLDFIVCDLPPGSSEEVVGAMRYLNPIGAIGVTTGSDLALEDYYRIRTMLEHFKIPLLLTIQNMNEYTCPKCGTIQSLLGSNQIEGNGEVVKVPMQQEVADTKIIPDFEQVAAMVIKGVQAA